MYLFSALQLYEADRLRPAFTLLSYLWPLCFGLHTPSDFKKIVESTKLPSPKGLSMEEASALPEAYATSYLNLFEEAHAILQRSENIGKVVLTVTQ